MTSSRVVVFGATGFVGSAAVSALRRRGVIVTPLTTPRILAEGSEEDVAAIASQLEGQDAAVIACGVAKATSEDDQVLTAANIHAPVLVARAAAAAGIARIVHVSSAAVQGAAAVLDSSAAGAPVNAYGRSKASAERFVRIAGGPAVVIYRPPGVHGSGRDVTAVVARLARSRWSSVRGAGTEMAPQALIDNVGDAIAFLALCEECPPAVVHHPWEGLTTRDLLELLSGAPPRSLPPLLVDALLAFGRLAGGRSSAVRQNIRRLEVLWAGQAVAPSWLTEAGWRPPAGRDTWVEIGERCTS